MATLVGFFANAKFLIGPKNDDNYVFFADQKPLCNGQHHVYFYEARFSWLSDRPFSSILSWLQSSGEKYPAEKQASMKAEINPARLSRRSNWLICGLCGLDAGGDEFLEIPNLEDYEKERQFLNFDFLAAYWLLHHFVAGNPNLLEDTMKLTSANSHFWVQEIKDYIKKPSEPLGMLDDDFIALFLQEAPDDAFEK